VGNGGLSQLHSSFYSIAIKHLFQRELFLTPTLGIFLGSILWIFIFRKPHTNESEKQV